MYPETITTPELTRQIASDNVINAAFDWLCSNRQEWTPLDDVWYLRMHWYGIKPRLQELLLCGEYCFSPLAEILNNEQLVADVCKRLIENSIICWNYAYLTNIIAAAESPEQNKMLLKTIKNKSVVSWEHINLGGTYDFSNNALSDEYNYKVEQLLNVTI